jgi:hypothetical protein
VPNYVSAFNFKFRHEIFNELGHISGIQRSGIWLAGSSMADQINSIDAMLGSKSADTRQPARRRTSHAVYEDDR